MHAHPLITIERAAAYVKQNITCLAYRSIKVKLMKTFPNLD